MPKALAITLQRLIVTKSRSSNQPTVSPLTNMAKEFSGVTVIVPANVYFDGSVTSRTVRFNDGTEKTLGLMQPGEYEFGTDKPELMEITAGNVSVQFAGETDWTSFSTGDSFNVPGSSRFKIKANDLTDYVCSYLDA